VIHIHQEFIKNSSSPVIVTHMAEDKAPHTEEQQTKPRRLRPWRPTRRTVLWAVGTLFTLVTIALLVALLVVNRDAVKWEDLLARERIEQVALFIGIAVALTTLFVLLAIGGASLGWTGFGDKTLWDWLQLLSALAIPVVLAAAGLWFTAQQDQRQQLTENKRAEAERALAEQRAQDEALQAYLDQMSQLILDEKLLKDDQAIDTRPVATLAQARTSTVILSFDAQHNESVTRFLSSSGLIWSSTTAPGLRETSSGLLSNTALSDAKLRGAFLPDADLTNVDLTGANLSNAILLDANLSESYLNDANLSGANLSGANLSGADLTGADLSSADLSSAVLNQIGSEAKHITKLEQQAASLEGATMPDGQKYEYWLKSKGRGEDRQNSGSS
jgi:uncharacterized protein YjbI with pentapeptide repeats